MKHGINTAFSGSGFVVTGLAIAVVILLLAISFLLFAIDANLFTKESSRFSVQRFDEIEKGDSIQSVSERLGDPIDVEELADNPLFDKGQVKVYIFEGDPPAWWPFYNESSVTVDKDGRVLYKLRKREP